MRGLVGGTLTVVGVMCFFIGIGLFIGNSFGVFPTFPFAGLAGTAAGGVLLWAGSAVSGGTLKAEVKEKWDAERRESFRFQNTLGQGATALVVAAFALGIGTFLYLAFRR